MIYIPGNVPSLKNTKQIARGRLIDCKRVRQYKKDTAEFFNMHKMDFEKMVEDKPMPYYVHFKFIRDSRRKFDYGNVVHILADLMTNYGWIEDDNADVFIPVFEPYEYKKNDGGVYIWVE